MRAAVAAAPVTRDLVARFVAGEQAGDAIRVTRALANTGLLASLDHLGEDVSSPQLAAQAVGAGERLLAELAAHGLASVAELSVKLSALGATVDPALATAGARVLCVAAKAAGTTLTVDMEDHRTTDATLAVVRDLRREHPGTGVVLQAYLRRSLADCREFASPGSRVRLCKGAYEEPETLAYTTRSEVDASYARCLGVLMCGDGYPMVATHDPRLIELARRLAVRAGRSAGDFEFQMLYGVRPDEQRRLAAAGYRVRVYVPYGQEWYGYLMRRLAERPANLALFLRAISSRG